MAFCLKICNYEFVFFWLGIWCESLVWVIMGRRGISQNAGVLIVLVGIIFELLFSYYLGETRFILLYNKSWKERLAPIRGIAIWACPTFCTFFPFVMGSYGIHGGPITRINRGRTRVVSCWHIIVYLTSIGYGEVQVAIRHSTLQYSPESKVHGSSMGPTWGRQDPGGLHMGRINLVIWEGIRPEFNLTSNLVICFNCLIVLKFCKISKRLDNCIGIMSDWEKNYGKKFTRYGFKISVGRIVYIAQAHGCSVNMIMRSYQYIDSHYTDRTLSWLSIPFILKWAPAYPRPRLVCGSLGNYTLKNDV